jgi:hypothetical protein
LLEARLATIRQILEAFHSPAEPEVPIEVPPGLERAQALWQTTRDYGQAFYELELRWHLEMLERVKHLRLERLPKRPLVLLRLVQPGFGTGGGHPVNGTSWRMAARGQERFRPHPPSVTRRKRPRRQVAAGSSSFSFE